MTNMEMYLFVTLAINLLEKGEVDEVLKILKDIKTKLDKK